MHCPSALDLLAVWERGLGQRSTVRALELLRLACPETALEELAAYSIGRRDALLLEMRDLTFGSEMLGLVDCKNCGERLELVFQTSDVRSISNHDSNQFRVVHTSGYELLVRVLDSGDLIAASAAAPEHRLQVLLERCVLEARLASDAVAVDQLPAVVVDAIAESLAETDPQADMHFAVTCPGCNQSWSTPFDIAAFFWTELDAWAGRILREVHVLASAYGWSESEILALGATRRARYLEMAGA